VPKGRAVTSRDDAWKAAQEIGLPIVIKPQDGNYGRGVSIDLQDEATIRAAYDYADREGSGVVAERMIRGFQHRVLVVKDKIVAASRGDAEHVMGDGVHTVVELVACANQQPLRGSDQESTLSTLVLDEIALGLLSRQDLTPTSIPPLGHQVVIHHNGDMTDDVTEEVHPDVAADCILAARTVGLNIAGIDLIANHIDQPLSAQDGAILEVNASPGLLMHLRPVNGKQRPVGTAVVSALFHQHETGRVPIVAVTGTNGKTSTVNLLENILRSSGKKLGVTGSDGIRIDGRQIDSGDCADAPSARRVLMNPFVDTAVFEVSANSVLNQGLAFDQCDVAVVTNIGSGDHLGGTYIETLEVITKAKRASVDVVRPGGSAVLNANDAIVAGLTSYCPGDTIFFGRAIEDGATRDMLAAGRRVVTIDRGNVVLAQNDKLVSILPVSALPHAHRGQLEFQVENALAAIGAAWALGISPSQMVAGLHATETVANCICWYACAGATILLSQCRNLSALNATISAMGLLSNCSELVATYGVHADQRASDVYDQGFRLGQCFDKVMLGSHFDPSADKLPPLLAELDRGVKESGHARDVQQIGQILDDSPHLQQAVERLEPKQVLMFQVKGYGGMSAARATLADMGAQPLASWPVSSSLGIPNSRESTQQLPSSNDV